jgi:hypothetical protein
MHAERAKAMTSGGTPNANGVGSGARGDSRTSDSGAVTAPESAIAFRVVRFDAVKPDIEQVYRGLGLRPDRPQHRRSVEQVHELAEVLPRLARPQAVFRIDEVLRLEPHRLELSSGAVFNGSVGQFLAHSRMVATFIVTIGSAIERLSRRWLRAAQVMRGAIVDALASEYAECTAQLCQDEVRAWARPQGLDITPRYSPGYCGMRVSQQEPLFAGLPASEINVRLTPSCLMVPIKSVSGLIGIGPDDLVKPGGYPCEYCDHPHCMQRRVPLRTQTGSCFDWAAHGAECPPAPPQSD